MSFLTKIKNAVANRSLNLGLTDEEKAIIEQSRKEEAALKEAYKADLPNAPTGELVKAVALNSLPDSSQSTALKAALAAGAVGTGVSLATLASVPVLAAASAGVGTYLVANQIANNNGELQELVAKRPTRAMARWMGRKQEENDGIPIVDGEEERMAKELLARMQMAEMGSAE